MHIGHVMQWEFKKSDISKICSLFGEGRITNLTVIKWFAKFCSENMTLNGELELGRPSEFDGNFLKEILEQNPCQARDVAKRMYTSQSTVCCHLEKLGNVFKLGA